MGIFFSIYARALMFCYWGSVGSFGKEVGESGNHSSYFAVAPEGVVPVDSVGAGDTWIASIIYHLSENVEWREALNKSTWIASQKVGVKGFNIIYPLSTVNLSAQAGA